MALARKSNGGDFASNPSFFFFFPNSDGGSVSEGKGERGTLSAQSSAIPAPIRGQSPALFFSFSLSSWHHDGLCMPDVSRVKSPVCDTFVVPFCLFLFPSPPITSHTCVSSLFPSFNTATRSAFPPIPLLSLLFIRFTFLYRSSSLNLRPFPPPHHPCRL